MKKKLLFVNKSFDMGGVQSSLINVLKIMSTFDVDIDLLVFNNSGYFSDKVPENIKILSPCLFVKTMGMSWNFVKKTNNILMILFKLFSSCWSKIFGNAFPIWFALKFQKSIGEYDYAIAYHHETQLTTMNSGIARFVLSKVVADQKIAWIHSDYIEAKLNSLQNGKIYSKLDEIICVSKSTMNSFLKCYPYLKEKTSYCYNYLPVEDIIAKSNESSMINIKTDNDCIVFFSACRLEKEKGILRTIEAMKYLKEQGYRFKWYIAGVGSLQQEISEKIQECFLEDSIFLMGYIDNIYPYVKQCDWLLLVSFHETFSMSAAEAMILHTPVLATDMPVANELIMPESGLICPNSYVGIKQGLQTVLKGDLTKTPDIISELKNVHLKLKEIFELC